MVVDDRSAGASGKTTLEILVGLRPESRSESRK
jgi:hypothetical protein